jgi:Cu/Ag efflux protein CusF
MKGWLMVSGVLTTSAVLAAGLAFAQPKADCKNRAQTPEKVEGQVMAVDQNSGRVTIREKNGNTHEFQANRDTLQDMKPGDKIEAKLREAPKC